MKPVSPDIESHCRDSGGHRSRKKNKKPRLQALEWWSSCRCCGQQQSATLCLLYAVIFTPPRLRRTNSGSVVEPSGNGLCFLRKNLTLASSTFTLQSRSGAQRRDTELPADKVSLLMLCIFNFKLRTFLCRFDFILFFESQVKVSDLNVSI